MQWHFNATPLATFSLIRIGPFSLINTQLLFTGCSSVIGSILGICRILKVVKTTPTLKQKKMLPKNNSNGSGPCEDGKQPMSLIVLLCLVFFLGFLLNAFSLWVFWFRMPRWTSGTTLQFHLALSDAIAFPVIPMMAVYFVIDNNWTFGRALCHVNVALLSAHFYGSTIFLTLITQLKV
ncbi:unnamed protein product [Pleuronectes platessa]|uniref:G-protein coupled receptors family 1 profile domain-containing protein n=1 Tax=Pleuronectes platessa TaxID=8262 RepID=A0A9N7YP38_PLEPL|nr:unnamed protein product [Pleuronectes platessa]